MEHGKYYGDQLREQGARARRNNAEKKRLSVKEIISYLQSDSNASK